MKKLLFLTLISSILLSSCGKQEAVDDTSTSTADVATNEVTIIQVPEGTDDGVYTGVKSSTVGNIGLAYVTIQDGKITNVDLHEYGHGHGGMIMANDKKNNTEYDQWMMDESSGTIWNPTISKLEIAIVENQGIAIEDIDALTGATRGFTSDELLIDAVNNAIILAKNSSDIFAGSEPTLSLLKKENRTLYTEVQDGTDDGLYIGTSTSSVGNVGLAYVTITDEHISNIEFHEIGHGHGGMIMANDKRDNNAYDQWMIDEASGTIWNPAIKSLEALVISNQTASISSEDVDAITSSTPDFSSNEMLLEAVSDAITVAKESSDVFSK